jgi:hypothetical protein
MNAALDAHTEVVNNLDKLKQSGFYTDCFSTIDKHPSWVMPSSAITERTARELVAVSRITIVNTPDVSVRDLELWREHVAGKSGIERYKGWQRWIDVMEAEGLLIQPRHEIERTFYDGFFGKGFYDGVG